ncbi:2Fe-2S iron-sulfur cluster-binding protein [Rhodopseudomonas palustris]|uniref:Ferredoxin n=1 Tax=Rhodopseudomonas palustris TaxID=1076 RepID=A0A418V2H1_RHOPL|nr:2Fe-2S iron-sulfur cluster-binding protein [Rhodopseudomonas palustris]RJF70253.1 ferredoxin [Rhodopseudomonas palustris]
MANITFSSPVMAKDVTVYAVAGDRGTILAVAKAHKIPIPFDCQDGECGSCLVQVEHFNPKAKSAVALTEKEKEVLRQLGKITKDEITNAEVNDIPPRYRLACQTFVRNEDILVKFEGDKTKPQKMAVTPAAAHYKGGLEINSLPDFFSYAAKVEQDAATHYDDLAKAMAEAGNAPVAKLFGQLAEFSRLHLAEVKARAGAIDVSKNVPPDYAWPDHATPERAAVWASDTTLTRLGALKAALQGERRGYEFYRAVEATTKSSEVAAAAKEFVGEEAEHVRILEAWITQEEWALKHAKTSESKASESKTAENA